MELMNRTIRNSYTEIYFPLIRNLPPTQWFGPVSWPFSTLSRCRLKRLTTHFVSHRRSVHLCFVTIEYYTTILTTVTHRYLNILLKDLFSYHNLCFWLLNLLIFFLFNFFYKRRIDSFQFWHRDSCVWLTSSLSTTEFFHVSKLEELRCDLGMKTLVSECDITSIQQSIQPPYGKIYCLLSITVQRL